MDWLYLSVAGLMEMGWPVALKYTWGEQGFRPGPAAAGAAAMALSGIFLLLAQRTIPIGTAYAVWTGIGAVGTFILGIVLFAEPAQATRFVCVGLIAAGIVGLKVFSAK
jgi:quaternary ammonium compound-resistance protein SugE